MHRPAEMNALSQAMRGELQDVFVAMEEDRTIRRIILTGGDYVFSAGLDLELYVEALLFSCADRKEHMEELLAALKGKKRK